MLFRSDDAAETDKKALIKELDQNSKLDHYTKIQLSKLTAPNGKANLSVYVYVPENLKNFQKDVTLRNRITKEQYELTDEGAARGDGAEAVPGKEHRWTDTKIAAIQLVYGIHAAGSVDNGNAEIGELAALFEKTFHVDLGNVYHAFGRLRGQQNPTAFLDEMKEIGRASCRERV